MSSQKVRNHLSQLSSTQLTCKSHKLLNSFKFCPIWHKMFSIKGADNTFQPLVLGKKVNIEG